MAARPRVVMLVENQTYPEDVRVRNEAESLTRAGWAVTVCAPRRNGQPPRDVVDGVEVRRFRLPAETDGIKGYLREYAVAHAYLFAHALVQLVRGARVVHLNNPPDTLFPIGLLARALGRRVVYDHHDLAPHLFESKFGPSRVVAVLRAAQRASFRTANRVLVTNESQRDEALASRKPAAEVAVVRNGPRRASLAPASEPPRGGALDDPRLVFVGELASQDGVMDLVALMADPRLAGARLTVVGDGPDRAPLERALAEAGIADRVDFTGWVPHAEVAGLIAAADICVDPAPVNPLNDRSTMIKIGEYLAAGRPAVAYELLETRRTAGEAALFAPAGDSHAFAGLVADLAADGERRALLGRRARERAEELVWERSEEALLDVYEQLRPAR
jgi:glycosyltransferase involved in cell wall biosynthesis